MSLCGNCNPITPTLTSEFIELNTLNPSSVVTLRQGARLCLMRLSAIGDVCHAVAMVQQIQRTRPDIKITWIIGKIEYQLLKGLKKVDFVVFDKKRGRQARNELKETLSGTEFDALFVMQVALRANWVSRVINAKVRIGFDKARSKELHSLFINHRIAPQAQAHVLDGFLGFAEAIGVQANHPLHWDMPVDSKDYEVATRLIEGASNYVVICPAASKEERCWTIEGYVALANHASSLGFDVVLCGGPASLDVNLSEKIAAKTSSIRHNLVGQTTLKQLLCILEKATLVIAPDTGPAHMATTVNTAVLGLYAHSNPRRTGPYNNQSDVVSVYDQMIQKQKGREWQALPWGVRAKGTELMENISVDDVIKRFDLMIAKMA